MTNRFSTRYRTLVVSTLLLFSLLPRNEVFAQPNDLLTQPSRLEKPSQDRRRLQRESCLMVQGVTDSDDGGPPTTTWECVLYGQDAKGGPPMVRLYGLSENFLQNSDSGTTLLWIENGLIDDDLGTLAVPVPIGAQLQLSTVAAGSNDKLPDGDKSVLVVRVIANDGRTTASAAELSDKFFGTSGDKINLPERFNSCSYGQTTMSPYSGTTDGGAKILNNENVGVIEVTIDRDVRAVNYMDVKNWVLEALRDLVGDLSDQFDHVMLCLPSGTVKENGGSWIGYGFYNSYLTMLNNDWCMSPSLQVHEVGHNYQLRHSNAKEEYEDRACLMGVSFREDEGPLMCFNAAKSWSLGWYPDRTMELDLINTSSYVIQLIGIDDYRNAAATEQQQVIVKLGNDDEEVFLLFNRVAGINEGTQEARNKVVLTRQVSIKNASERLKALREGGKGKVSNYRNLGRKVKIKVLAINLDANPAYAEVKIKLKKEQTRLLWKK